MIRDPIWRVCILLPGALSLLIELKQGTLRHVLKEGFAEYVAFFSNPTSNDCNSAVHSNQGCGVKSTLSNSYGPGFNSNGGGWSVICVFMPRIIAEREFPGTQWSEPRLASLSGSGPGDQTPREISPTERGRSTRRLGEHQRPSLSMIPVISPRSSDSITL
jgi:hypothetical protein